MLLILLLSFGASFAQEKKSGVFSPFENRFLSTTFPTATSLLIASSLPVSRQQILKPFSTGVYYNSFFCKMEVQNLKRYHVWIKFHAGDYDKYSREVDQAK